MYSSCSEYLEERGPIFSSRVFSAIALLFWIAHVSGDQSAVVFPFVFLESLLIYYLSTSALQAHGLLSCSCSEDVDTACSQHAQIPSSHSINYTRTQILLVPSSTRNGAPQFEIPSPYISLYLSSSFNNVLNPESIFKRMKEKERRKRYLASAQQRGTYISCHFKTPNQQNTGGRGRGSGETTAH